MAFLGLNWKTFDEGNKGDILLRTLNKALTGRDIIKEQRMEKQAQDQKKKELQWKEEDRKNKEAERKALAEYRKKQLDIEEKKLTQKTQRTPLSSFDLLKKGKTIDEGISSALGRLQTLADSDPALRDLIINANSGERSARVSSMAALKKQIERNPELAAAINQVKLGTQARFDMAGQSREVGLGEILPTLAGKFGPISAPINPEQAGTLDSWSSQMKQEYPEKYKEFEKLLNSQMGGVSFKTDASGKISPVKSDSSIKNFADVEALAKEVGLPSISKPALGERTLEAVKDTAGGMVEEAQRMVNPERSELKQKFQDIQTQAPNKGVRKRKASQLISSEIKKALDLGEKDTLNSQAIANKLKADPSYRGKLQQTVENIQRTSGDMSGDFMKALNNRLEALGIKPLFDPRNQQQSPMFEINENWKPEQITPQSTFEDPRKYRGGSLNYENQWMYR